MFKFKSSITTGDKVWSDIELKLLLKGAQVLFFFSAHQLTPLACCGLF